MEGPGRVLAGQEWVVARTPSGAVSATMRDHQTGGIESTVTAEPARGDAVRFRLYPAASEGHVTAGDTVGLYVSSAEEVRWAGITGRIAAAEAELALFRSGEKGEVIEGLRQRLQHARAALSLARREEARQRAMLERGVVATEVAERTAVVREQAAATVAATAADLLDAQTGARDEQVQLAEVRLDGLRREADVFRAGQRARALVAPISGRVSRTLSLDTLLVVADTSSYAALIPVRWADKDRVQVGQEVELSAGGAPARGRIVDVQGAAAPTTGQAYLVARADVTEGAEHLAPGLLVRARIQTPPQALLDHARDIGADLIRW